MIMKEKQNVTLRKQFAVFKLLPGILWIVLGIVCVILIRQGGGAAEVLGAVLAMSIVMWILEMIFEQKNNLERMDEMARGNYRMAKAKAFDYLGGIVFFPCMVMICMNPLLEKWIAESLILLILALQNGIKNLAVYFWFLFYEKRGVEEAEEEDEKLWH